MITYSQMRSWRDICEYLNTCWYKFDVPYGIKSKCPHALPNLVNPKVRSHREIIYNNYLIQFITWSQHPILNYSRSKAVWREWSDLWGWRLCSDWEYKIEYLEQIILFDKEPSFKHWEPALRDRLYQREQRRKKKELEEKLKLLKDIERKEQAANLGICWRCFSPIIIYMVDCVNCGAEQL